MASCNSTLLISDQDNKFTTGTICQGCNIDFGSRNAVFKHLKATKGACLSGEEFKTYQDIVLSQERVKTILLIGYLCDLETDLSHGDHVISLILDVLFEDERDKKFFNRSYGNNSRGVDITRQDDGSNAMSEILCIKIAPLVDQSLDEWIATTNKAIASKVSGRAQIRVLGRCDFPHFRFNAEMDFSHCRYEYILPVDFLSTENGTRKEFEMSFPIFSSAIEFKLNARPNAEALDYLLNLKRTMRLLCCQIEDLDLTDEAAVMEKYFSEKKRKRQQKRKQKERTTKRVLRRRRFHNFSPRAMAHEYLAFRRLDRIYHRATMIEGGKTFFAISMTGDLFLNGQCSRVIGLLVALMKGLIPQDIIECIFDEQYLHLVPAPALPSFALLGGEAAYMTWEGKAKVIMTPRETRQYPLGFNSDIVLDRVAKWEGEVHKQIINTWLESGLDEDGRLISEKNWFENILKPWAEGARRQLEDYRRWKSSLSSAIENVIPSLSNFESLDTTTPEVYQEVLLYLQKADASGLWPSTTPKRQLVMVSTKINDESTVSLAMAHVKAKFNKEDRASAYTFEEGQGGASGSFSVGAFPGEMQPKGNEIFPELMKAAFKLERVLMPNREPSSTIAINRNAQFRPHTDSGAGAGQSTSLIVGLGNYTGGELVVEGEQKDIRYKPLEFNGWTQRHWTMPFQGERYSLVWFTPKGCEGIRGIDLC
jgi:tRNA U38,U39,U40 pseudouridine synthase TruA